MPESPIDLAGLQVGAADFLATVLETMWQPLWVVDRDGRIRFANPAAISALGYERADELMGRDSHATVHYRRRDGAPYPAEECPLLRPATTGQSVASELDWFVRRDGSMVPVAYVSVPLEMGDGRGALVAFTDIEDRLRLQEGQYDDADATLAAQHAALRDELARLADEQAALRRVATLVAQGVPAPELFGAVTEEVGRLLRTDAAAMIRYERDEMTAVGSWTAEGVAADTEVGRQWPMKGDSLAPRILRTRKPARIDDWGDVAGSVGDYVRAKLGLTSSVGSPILVGGEVWGNLVVHSTSGRLPDDTEARLAGFTELVATAVANTEAQERAGRLADEQAALRRVATLVARAVAPNKLFVAVAAEVGGLLGADLAGMIHYESGGTVTAVATWAAAGEHPEVRGRWSLEGDRLATTIATTGRPAREDDWGDVAGPIAAFVRDQLGIDSTVGSPVVVEGRVWGALFVHSTHGEPLPAGTEARLADFTELVATAISNSEARAEVGRLAEEQAALRHVATLVARAVPPSELFRAVAKEVGCLLGADFARMIRYENEHAVSPVATWAAVGEHPAVPASWTTEVGDLPTQLLQTHRPARIDDWSDVPGPIAAYVREELGPGSSVGSPIIVEERLWGALIVHLKGDVPLPEDTESRLLNFTELVATAISNSEARAEVERLADEQAGLRRVATLVARESSPAEVFAAVGEEVRRLLQVEATSVFRYEEDGTATVVASSGQHDLQVGDSLPVEGESVTARVLRTGRPARLEDYAAATGRLGTRMREAGIRSAVGAPIVVEGRLWGVVIAATRQEQSLPSGAESRVEEFTELVATAISNVQARSDLATSRARIVAAADEERRRVVRDLHDGAQQRLVHTVVTLKLASRALQADEEGAPALVTQALDQAQLATNELRELSHGILPTVLTRGGLRAGVQALASRTPVPVEVDVSVERLPATIEATAYFVVAEGLTNVAKHSRAQRAAVSARIERDTLRLEVRDDGVGGARTDGTGLVGLRDRLAVLDGRLRVESPRGAGTRVTADIPVAE
jgi:PAS domain S-box-containing protein